MLFASILSVKISSVFYTLAFFRISWIHDLAVFKLSQRRRLGRVAAKRRPCLAARARLHPIAPVQFFIGRFCVCRCRTISVICYWLAGVVGTCACVSLTLLFCWHFTSPSRGRANQTRTRSGGHPESRGLSH